MPKLSWLFCLLFVAVLVLAVTGASPAATVRQVQAGDTNEGSEALTFQTSIGSGQALWLRLRWLLAGGSACAILLVGARQLRVLTTPKTRSIVQSDALDLADSARASAEREWYDEAYGAHAGD